MYCGMQNHLRFCNVPCLTSRGGYSDPHFGSWIASKYDYVRSRARYRQPVLIRSRLPAAWWPRRVGPHSLIRNGSRTVVLPTVNQCCDIFIPQNRINSGRTGALLKPEIPWNHFEVYKFQLANIKIMKFSGASIIAFVALFSKGLAAGVQHCASYCPLQI